MEKALRIFRPENRSFFLLGPRGTGKSTLIRDSFPDALYIDLLLPDIYRSYLARPERLRELIHANTDRKVVIIDEVQKVPELLGVVHSLMEDKRGIQFVLTGSSARKLKKTGADMLAGRAVMRRMHPFLASEIKNTFRLDSALTHGMIPVVVDSDNPIDTMHSYIDLYIREEVLMEGLTRNFSNFSRFLEVACFSHGAQLNISTVARDCGVDRKTVEGYVRILEDLLLAFKVPVFTRRAKRATVQHPKFYFFDAGVFSALRPSGPLDRPEEKAGPALEGLVAQHLRAWLDYRHPQAVLHYWRTSAGSEVDFIVYGENLFQAIEVKNATTIHPKDLRPLKAFGQDYPEAERILLYRGSETLFRDGILIKPCDEYLPGLS